MAEKNTFANFANEKHPDLTLRDYLAIDRTLLANERSFLAYIRTAITLLIAGISLIKFFNSNVVQSLGIICIAVAALILLRGFRRYKATQHIFEQLKGLSNDHSIANIRALPHKFLKLSKQLVKVFYK
jgi:putative membrane protein